jgi:hypothetical protein
MHMRGAAVIILASRPYCFPPVLILSFHPISLLLAATEDRDQEIVPSAEGSQLGFWA